MNELKRLEPGPAEEKRRRRRPSPWLIGLATFVLLFGLSLGFVLGLLWRLGQPLPDGERVSRWPLLLSERVNVLFIGTDVTLDRYRRIVPVSRSDTLILVTFDPERKRVLALSIPRDTRAEIPGVGVTKINASYAFGGASLTVRTVEELLGVRIPFYLQMGVKGFVRLIDALGGIEVDVERDMYYVDRWAGLTINLKKGRQHLNGEQAMGYARFRHEALGDIARVQRQQKVILAILQKLRSPSTWLRLPQVIRTFSENTETNLTLPDLLTLGWFAFRVGPEGLSTATLPGHFSPGYWEPDWEKIRPLIARDFLGVDPEDLDATPIEVLNGSEIPGLARQTARRLEKLGFRITRIGTSPQRVEGTAIIDRAGRPRIVRALLESLGEAKVMAQPEGPLAHSQGIPGNEPGITVILGREFSSP
ncbi:MAG: LCP family protein [Armatimonadota bacterium]|nr:LCP family protein [Armatimonadota bacterium]MDR5703761.1 LCP family protein [Armatimonadota bacterium]MDR7433972.1 LCP family protein [Armatimonadota bacterium]